MLKKLTLFCMFGVGLSGCSEDTQETATLSPSPLPMAVKKALEEDCGSCHGIPEENYEAYVIGDRKDYFYFPVDSEGKITDAKLTKEVVFGHGRVNMSERAGLSDFLRIPLVKDFGGKAHKGLDIYFSTTEPNYKAIESWLDSEIKSESVAQPEKPDNLAFFEEKVVPVMTRNGCFMSSCHGETTFTDLKLQAPLPSGEMTRFMLEHNHESMLGKVTRFVNLAGDLNKSRIITKNIPISEGGIHQRGGNNMFFSDLNDPDVEILREWMRKEQLALTKTLRTDKGALTLDDLSGEVKGVVFIRGDKHQPRKFFDLDKFYGGSNIFLSTGETETQLTHFENAEVQALDVSYDAQSVVFSMRKSPEEGFRIYQMSLDTLEVEKLSGGVDKLEDGTIVHHIDPSYKTGYKDANNLSDVDISYASNEAGQYTQSEQWAIIGEADNDSTAGIIVDRQRHEKEGSYTGRKIHILKGDSEGVSRVIVRHELNKLFLDEPLDGKVDVTTIYEIEKPEPSYLPAYDIYTFTPHEFDETKARITWNNAQERKPTMRTSGALMTTTVRNLAYQDDKPVFNGAIFRLEAGGWDFHPHGGERSRFPLYTDSREMAGGLELRLAHDPRNLWSGGTMVLADHGMGTITEPNNPTDDLPLTEKMDEVDFSAIPRYISEQVVVDKAANYTGYSKDGAYRDPYPLPDGSILVAHTDKAVDHLDPTSNPDWDIYQVVFDKSPHAKDGHNAGSFKKVKLFGSTEGKAEYNPRPVVIRLQEDRHHAIKGQKFITGIDTHLKYGVQRAVEETPSEIEIYDVPLLFSFLTNFTQEGKREILPDGEIKYVRILKVVGDTKADVEQVDAEDPYATASKLGVHKRKLIVAEAPVESDNSAYIQLPNGSAWIFQALDKDKKAFYTFQREFFTQSGEKFTQSIPRSKYTGTCSGCHGSLSGKVSTAFGEPDLHTAASEVIATYNEQESVRRKPFGFGNTNDDYIDIDFVSDVQPIFNKHCVSCHTDTDLDLSGDKTRNYTVSYESLHQLKDPETKNFSEKKYVSERESLSAESELIRKLELGEANHSQLSKDELLMLTRWIDMGATFKGVYTDEK